MAGPPRTPNALEALAGSRGFAYALVVAAAVAFVFHTHGYAILGMDSYPAIASGLLRSPLDVLTIFTSPAVPGRVPYAFHGFYRPITTISLGIDHALFGVDPRGYFVTQALLFAACAILLYELARLLLGASAVAGTLAALVAFLLAPSHVETLTVVARRSELLCGLFSLLALLTQVPRIERRVRWKAVLPAAFTFLALISKTTGIALLPAVFVLALLRAPVAGLAARVREAIETTVPHVVATVLAFAVQIAILGQVGGHVTSRASGGIDRLPWALEGLARWLFVPQPALRESAVTWLLLALLAAALAATLVLRAVRARDEADASAEPALQTAAVATVWLLGCASLYGAVGLLQGWYVFVPALAYALLCGALVDRLACAARSTVASLRTAARAALVLAALWIAWQSPHSMLVSSYSYVARASELTRFYLGELTQRIATTPDGRVLVFPPPPRRLSLEPGERTLDGPLLVPEYALQSWVECAFPHRKVVIQDRRERVVTQPDADTLKIVFRP